ncbi:MAG: TIGR00282 family metallophosphoesterase [Akkermansia sp.]|nr:TIGR00282 family metallophosphoesterase [Akkermansia sp.]
MKVIFLGDVVGEPGRLAMYRALPELREEFGADAIVVNGENAAGGKGITPRIAQEFLESGVDAITLGDHVWDQSDLIPWIDSAPQVLRPFNLQENTPGAGSSIISTPAGKLGILCLQGRTFMRPGAENPFTHGQAEAQRMRSAGAQAILVDIHAEASSEKIALGYHLDGYVSAVLGTHTHVQTADARLLPGGTAYLTDAGMCGSLNGVIGREAAPVLSGYITGMPCKFPIGGWPAMVSGVCITIDTETGKATEITLINRVYDK